MFYDDKKKILEPLSKVTESNKKQYIADVKVMNYLLQAIPNDIYNSVDACKNAKEMLKQIKRLMFGSDVTNHCQSTPSFSIACNPIQFEPYVQASKAKRAIKNHDPLALIAYSNASSSLSHANPFDSHSPQPYYVTHPSSFVDYEEDYEGELQGDSQEDKLTTIMIVDIQTKNVGYGRNGNKNAGRENRNQAFNAGNGNDDINQIVQRVPRTESNSRKENVQFMKDESGSNLNDEENYFILDNSFGDETLEELTAAVIMMGQIQPANDNGVQKPNYDVKAISEKIMVDQINMTQLLMINIMMSINSSTSHAWKDTKSSYDPFLKAGLGYKNLKRLKKAIAAQPKMYHGEKLYKQKNELLENEIEKISSDSKDIQANLLKRIKILENDFKRSQAQSIDFELKLQHQKDKMACDVSWKSRLSTLNDENVIQLVLWIIDSRCSKHMSGNLQLLRNFIEKFIGTIRFENDHFAAITGYRDYVQRNLMTCHVYYVEGLEHNLFSVGQFCDGDLVVAFHSNTCYVWNMEGLDLLTDSCESNLYTISIFKLAASSPVCLLSKATSIKSWLWHRRLSHLNFGTINQLTSKI
ncbi:integrase, catalytic region, zinc finger, CCHC-type containing protein [Tanacetum coccineum]|uniref:Integrase, catalytic region, zinc finger, CCHC-type containing protein n=1 Tax=Tanacetum coccineum TaxID=301880 RepID=A0ABQ5HE67_9ASTR